MSERVQSRWSRVKLAGKAALCCCVLFLPLLFLDWSDRVVGPTGRTGTVVASDTEKVKVRYAARGAEIPTTTEWLPRNEIRRWIQGIESMIRRIDVRFVGLAIHRDRY